MSERRWDELPSSNKEKLLFWLSQVESQWQNPPKFQVDPERLGHLAIICDGNRRSAQEKGLFSQYGHELGMGAIKGIMRACREWGIHTVTFWVWSTENWRREREQVDFIMSLAVNNLTDKSVVEELITHKVKFVHLGRKDRLPRKVRDKIEQLEHQTEGFDQYHLNVAMDYGGVDEVALATISMFEDIQRGKLLLSEISTNPELILRYLYTTDQPPPDLVVRTGMKNGELSRTSGFLPLQSAYACWTFIPENFPDLKPESLLNSIIEFLDYERRFGR